MSIAFTGLARNACEDLLRLADLEANAHYMPAQAMLQCAKSHLPSRVVWLYRAPWALPEASDALAPDSTVDDVLAHWLDLHRKLLRKRRTLGAQLVLVNAELVRPAQLLTGLGVKQVAGESSKQEAASSSAMTAFLSQAFASGAPELWDVYEALEALAWRPEGHDGAAAELVPPSPAEGMRLYQMLLDSHAVPVLKTALAQAREQARKAERSGDAALTQLRQALEDQQAQVLHEQTAHEARVIALQAQAEHQAKELAAATDALEQARGEAEAGRAAVAQLEQDLAAQQVRAEQEQAVLEAELSTLRAHTQAQAKDLAAALAALEQARAQAQAVEQASRGELAQSQQALEAVRAAAARELAAANAALEQARAQALAAEQGCRGELAQLQQALEAARATAAHELAAANAALEQTRAQALAAEQTGRAEQSRLQQALEAARTAAAQDKAVLETELGALQTQIRVRTEEVAATSAALEQLRTAKKARVAALDKLKLEFAAAEQQWSAKLQDREAALAGAVRSAEQAQAGVAELQEENDQVWQQLLQAQEEVERHFLENRQLQEALSQSRHTLERARFMVSRLMAIDTDGDGDTAPTAERPVAEMA